jgi:hypothetical protein
MSFIRRFSFFAGALQQHDHYNRSRRNYAMPMAQQKIHGFFLLLCPRSAGAADLSA